MELTLQAYDWQNNIRDDVNEILCWALSMNNEGISNNSKILLRIYNIPSICYLRLPRKVGGVFKNWSPVDIASIQDYLNAKFNNNSPYIELVTGKTLYFYSKSNTEKFIRMYFKSNLAKKNICKDLKGSISIIGLGSIQCNILEEDEVFSNIVLQFLSKIHMNYSQWFKLKVDNYFAQTAKYKISNLQYEFIIYDASQTIIPLPPEKTVHLRTNPGILVMDIETRSPNHRSFPNADIPDNYAYMISCIYQEFNRPDTLRKYLILVGDSDPIPGSEVIHVKDEIEMIRMYEHLVNILDPVIITGYNIFGYDFSYLFTRLRRWLYNWSTDMSLLKDDIPKMYDKEWKSSAYSFTKVCYPDIPGRVHIDMLTVAKRSYKLPLYSLNKVSQRFLGGEGKDDMSAFEMFEIYDIKDQIKRNKEIARVGKYCVQDSVLVLKLFEKFGLWHSLIEESNINDVPMSYLTTRGQQIRVINKIIRVIQYRSQEGDLIVIDKAPQNRSFFVGGFVREPKTGKFNNVFTWDYASLYPSIMQAFNLCFTTLINPVYNDQVSDDLAVSCKWTDSVTEKKLSEAKKKGKYVVEQEENAGKDIETITSETGEKTFEFTHEYKYVKPEVYEGIMPFIVRQLVNERKKVRHRISQVEKVEKTFKISQKFDNCDYMINLAYIIYNLDNLTYGIEIGAFDEEDPINAEFDKFKEIIDKIYNHIDRLNSSDVREIKNKIDIDIDVDSYINYNIILKEEFMSNYNEYKKLIDVILFILDSRQKALKNTANSFYGFMAAIERGILPCVEVGVTITAMGRKLIKRVYNYVTENYPELIEVYGDTDSAMFSKPIIDKTLCYKYGNAVAEAITNILPPPLKLEFEKVFAVFIAFTKKNYAGVLMDKHGNLKLEPGELFIRGLPPVRRDYSDWISNFFMDCLMCVFTGKPIMEIFHLVENYLYGLYRREFTVEDLIVTVNIGLEYKNDKYAVALFKKYYSLIGRPLIPGERVAYVMIDTGIEDDYKGNKMRTIEHYNEMLGTDQQMKIDYRYYLEHMLSKQTSRILKTCYKEIEKYDIKMHHWPSVRKRQFYIDYCSEYVECLLRLVDVKKAINQSIQYFVPLYTDEIKQYTVMEMFNSKGYMPMRWKFVKSKKDETKLISEFSSFNIDNQEQIFSFDTAPIDPQLVFDNQETSNLELDFDYQETSNLELEFLDFEV